MNRRGGKRRRGERGRETFPEGPLRLPLASTLHSVASVSGYAHTYIHTLFCRLTFLAAPSHLGLYVSRHLTCCLGALEWSIPVELNPVEMNPSSALGLSGSGVHANLIHQRDTGRGGEAYCGPKTYCGPKPEAMPAIPLQLGTGLRLGHVASGKSDLPCIFSISALQFAFGITCHLPIPSSLHVVPSPPSPLLLVLFHMQPPSPPLLCLL